MTKDDVLKALIKFFKDVNAVDPNLSDSEIGEIELPKLDIFKHELANDPDFKKEVIFKKMVSALKEAHPNNVPPQIAPQDESVFNTDITIEQLAAQISRDTPDMIF